MDLVRKYEAGDLKSLHDETNQRSFCNSIKNLSKVYPLGAPIDNFSICVHASLDTSEVLINCILLHRNLPFRINYKNNRLLAIRFINKLNAQLRLGMLVLEPVCGILKFKAVLIPPQEMEKQAKLLKAMLTCCEKFQAALLHLNSVLKLLDDEAPHDQSLARIKYCLENYEKHPKLQNIKPIGLPQQQQPKIEKQQGKKIKQLDILKKLQSYLVHPELESVKTNQKTNIFNEINVKKHTQINWTLICPTLTSSIYAASVQFTFKQSYYQDPVKKIIVKKQVKPSFQQKIDHQKNILSIIQNARNPYVPKFYRSDQPTLSNCLFSDYYKYCSCETYLKQTAEYTSLLTKLRLLYSAGMGLLFLHKHGIIHADFKPKNLLISSQLFSKVNDFGQSYSAKVCGANYQPGYTLPYSAPEIFNKGTLNQKYDVFSLGFTILQIIFEVNPQDVFDCQSDFKEHMINLTYREKMFRVCQERFMEFGPRGLMPNLLFLCKQCLSPEQDKRPDLSWCVAIIRESLQFLGNNF